MKYSIALIFSLLPAIVFAQSSSDIAAFKTAPVEQEDHHKHIQEYNGEAKMFLGFMFLGYKRFISSQDGSRCNFNPSCSVYAVQAIQDQGIILGVINFFDRFARCNNFSPNQYEKDYASRLFYDPLY
ncbi:MAG: membrane protein insertion efficiency factor YidD [Flavobacteriales bacterium]|nr:membrane protein insertion efficiency factor YidD [Flavobacteriales bacterium]